MTDRRRLIWIGLDGASIEFFDRFIAEGRLPNFARLQREGVVAQSLPMPPCDTPTNWTVLQTGANPGSTGVISFFTHRPGDPLDVASNTMHSGAVGVDTIWQAAERAGRRVIALNWPCSWPSRLELDGSVQIGGTAPLTASWRMSYGRVYCHGELGGRTVDPVFERVLGGFSDRIVLEPAKAWVNVPPSFQPPLEMSFDVLGRQRFTWSETGMQTNAELADGLDQHIYHALIVDGQNRGYDRVIVARERDVATAVGQLAEGEWTEFISDQFSPSDVLEQHIPIEEDSVEGLFKVKLVRLAPDASAFALYRTDVWQADGWAHPEAMAEVLREAVGPFTEGLEMPPPTSRVLDEWGTYQEQLSSACNWYASAAAYLTSSSDWDVLAVQLHVQDGLNHILARDLCPEDDTYTESNASSSMRHYEYAYEACDALLGRLVDECADRETVVCVVSDHGGLPTLKQCLVSGALVRAGLLAYQHDPVKGTWDIDWTRTKVFPRRSQLWVNLLGRDPDGIVPASEYEDVREQAIRALLSIYDEEWRTRPIVAALRKEDAVAYGQWGDSVGDIVIFMAPRYADSEVDYTSLPSDPDSTPDIGPTQVACAHHPYLPNARFGMWSIPAVFFLAGPGVRHGHRRKAPITQVDVAPTLCHLLGIRPPLDSEGMVASDLLE